MFPFERWMEGEEWIEERKCSHSGGWERQNYKYRASGKACLWENMSRVGKFTEGRKKYESGGDRCLRHRPRANSQRLTFLGHESVADLVWFSWNWSCTARWQDGGRMSEGRVEMVGEAPYNLWRIRDNLKIMLPFGYCLKHYPAIYSLLWTHSTNL